MTLLVSLLGGPVDGGASDPSQATAGAAILALWEHGRIQMKRPLAVALALPGAALAYRAFLREPILNWGARPDEVGRRLPGDELLEAAEVVSTRAVTIDAPPSAVWPWLIQMGPGRGGAYTYDWIENLFGLDMHSVDRIVPA